MSLLLRLEALAIPILQWVQLSWSSLSTSVGLMGRDIRYRSFNQLSRSTSLQRCEQKGLTA